MNNLREELANMPPDRRRQTLRELPSKLVEAEKVDKLHALLAKEHEGRNAWFEAKEAYAETASYLENVRSAWDQAKKEFNQNPGVAIALQYRYALVTTTLNSLSRNIPASLIAALVEKGLWTAAQGLAYAQQVKKSNQQEDSQQAKVLSALAPHLSQELLQQALKAARGIQDDSERAQALRGLASHFPEVRQEALEAACGIQDDYGRAFALKELIPYLPEVLPKALKAALSIQDNYWRIDALCKLAPYSPEAPREAFDSVNDLDTSGIKYIHFNDTSFNSYLSELASYFPDKLLQQALDVARGFQNGRICASTLKALAPHLSEELLRQALDIARSIQDDSSRALALIGLLPRLPEIRQETLDVARSVKDDASRALALSELVLHLPEIRKETLDAACSIKDNSSRALALSKLAPYLSEELLQKAVDITRRMKDDAYRVEALSILAPYLPEAPQLMSFIDFFSLNLFGERVSKLTTKSQVLQEALDIACRIQSDHERAESLGKLAPHLSQKMLKQALKAAQIIKDDAQRAIALSKLVPYLPEARPLANDAIDAITSQHDFVRVLSEIASSFSEEALQNILDNIHEFDSSLHLDVLKELVPFLPEAQQEAALKFVLNIQDYDCYYGVVLGS